MAAKFDGKHARMNMWVTHQNLARAKGGRPSYQFKERKVPSVPQVVVVAPAAATQAEPKPSEGAASGPLADASAKSGT